MKKYIIISFITFLTFSVYGQFDLTIITDTINGYGLFLPGRIMVWPLKTKLEIKDKPSEVKEYCIRAIDFEIYNTLFQSFRNGNISHEEYREYLNRRSIDSSLITEIEYDHVVHVLLGNVTSDSMIIIFDKNSNMSFTDDEKFIFPIFKSKEEEINAKENLPITYLSFELFDGTHIKQMAVPITIDPYKGYLRVSFDEDSIEQKFYLSVGLAFHRYCDIKINNRNIRFNISNRSSGFTFNKINTFLILSDENNQTSELNGAIPYTLGDIITIDSLQYEFNYISTLGDSIYLKFLGYNKYPEGFLEGNYLPKMKAVTIDRYQFEFGSLRGKYLLLDFWGTWCAPCIKLIPQIRDLNNKFRDRNFVLVSIAYDNDEEKVRQFINNNQMNWIHLIQDNSNNVIIKELKVTQYPTMILIDPSGKIVSRGKEINEIDDYLSGVLTQ